MKYKNCKIIVIEKFPNMSNEDIFGHKALDAYFESPFKQFDSDLFETEIGDILYQKYEKEIKRFLNPDIIVVSK